MRLKRLLVAIAVGVLLAMTGCSGSGSSHPLARAPSTQTGPGGTGGFVLGMNAFAEAPAPPIPDAKEGGTLTVLGSGGLAHAFDPSNNYYTKSISIESGLVVRSLTQYVYDPKSKQMILVPDLATDLGRPSLDFKTWRFTLRSGVKFENGRSVTPEDIKYGIERSFDRKTFPSGPDYSNQYFLDGDTYRGPYRSPGPYPGVTISGRTITIRMSHPFPDMPYWGSFPAMSPVPPGKASDPATYKNHPWATGPYMFKDYTAGKSLTLVKNPYWAPGTDPGRHQYVDSFDFRFDADPSRIDQIMLADTGTGKTTISSGSILTEDFRTFNRDASDRLVEGSLPCTQFLYPDNRSITDIAVRRALGYAYPYRAAWAATGYIPGVTRIPATNVMPPGVAGRVAYNPLPGHRPGSTDPAQARALLSGVGKLNYPIRWAYPADEQKQVALKSVLETALRRAGFDPQPISTTSAKYVDDFLLNPKADLNLRELGWCSDWPGGDQWLPPELQSTDIAEDGFGFNLAAFSSAAVDGRMRAIPHLLLTRQAPAWNDLDRDVETRDYPLVATAYDGVALMRGSKVHGDVVDTTFGYPTWKDIWIG